MRIINYIAAAALATSPTAASAQTLLPAAKAKSIMKALLTAPLHRNGAMDGMDLNTTKPSLTTTYTREDNAWSKTATTKTEYNKKGYVTATETSTAESRTRTENTYGDEALEGLVTKTTTYTWDAASAAWANPTVMMQLELEKDKKDRVTKETVYAYNDDTKKLEKTTEINFGYSFATGKMNSLSTTIQSVDENGNPTEMEVKVTILKWYKYNADKLFQLSLDNMGTDLLSNKENMIESATITMNIMNMPITGTLNGKYSDTESSVTLRLPFMGNDLLNMTFTSALTDSYGSNLTTLLMNVMGNEMLNATIKNTNNEHGDCIKTETSGTSSLDDNTLPQDADNGTGGIGDLLDGLDLNQTMTYDYEYTTLAGNKVMKQSMTTNLIDKASGEATPTTKITYDQYTDYVSGTTGIKGTRDNATECGISAIYDINGTRVDNYPSATEKGVYIVKKAGKSIKVMR